MEGESEKSIFSLGENKSSSHAYFWIMEAEQQNLLLIAWGLVKDSSLIQGFIFFFFASIVSLVFYLKGKKRKLKVVVISLSNLINLKSISIDEFEIKYNKKNITSLWVANILIHNDGSEDVTDSMVRVPVELSFPEGVEIIDAETLSTSIEENVIPEIASSRSIKFDISYLKRKHVAVIQILIDFSGREKPIFKNINLKGGLIENFDLSIINFPAERSVRGGTVKNFLRKHRRKVVIVILSFYPIPMSVMAIQNFISGKWFHGIFSFCMFGLMIFALVPIFREVKYWKYLKERDLV